MGIDSNFVKQFDRLYDLGVLKSPMLMMGRQIYKPIDYSSTRMFFDKKYGIEDYTELDMDGGDLMLDLNQIHGSLARAYNTVMNLGTLEHVWDAHSAWSNAITAVKLGGHFISLSPYCGWQDHGIHITGPRWISQFVVMNGFKTLEVWDVYGPKSGDICMMLVAQCVEAITQTVKPQQIYSGGVKP